MRPHAVLAGEYGSKGYGKGIKVFICVCCGWYEIKTGWPGNRMQSKRRKITKNNNWQARKV